MKITLVDDGADMLELEESSGDSSENEDGFGNEDGRRRGRDPFAATG